ncbi:MAG: adenosine deaminase [Bdellovibrio sp. CG12_big_fil_rev_8_21_14_0_65_39_13]|nr:MAG: adenosine deaminase [Bdellovibrio sp. CG22_combo_CG10-13_8_21_14_all_39_27]PIQ62175.1 MAG: adenosine deaminase [Bdellovibrio sp. CG12_big_fil_rev_8_21_14_0_65_39_13]PIR34186.1 MAG: adenosine deaminase [Bdellovibrio sp. CG11_big_fil_rev_8_21_14_0_20_39_38]
MKYDINFLKEIPKTDLHLHLDGSLRINSLIEMSKKLKVALPSSTEEGLKELVFKDQYQNLGEYLHGFQYTCAAMRDLENIERAAYELAIDNQEEGVNYIEVRFAPQLLIDNSGKLTFESIMQATADGLERAKKEYNNSSKVKVEGRPEFHYGIICCAMRMFTKAFSPYYNNLFAVMNHSSSNEVIRAAAMDMVKACVKLRDESGIPIVGVDIAGQEAGFPASNFKEMFAYAHKHFLSKTIHAGEAYGAESIFDAITECHANRIGHGYTLFAPELITHPEIKDKQEFVKRLASFIADQRIVIEVCLTSNLQTNPAIKDIKNHKLGDMLANRIATTFCTDNRLVSNTTVTKEFKLATDNFDIPLAHLKDIIAYGFKKSFHHGTYLDKRKFANENLKYFDKIASRYAIPTS